MKIIPKGLKLLGLLLAVVIGLPLSVNLAGWAISSGYRTWVIVVLAVAITSCAYFTTKAIKRSRVR